MVHVSMCRVMLVSTCYLFVFIYITWVQQYTIDIHQIYTIDNFKQFVFIYITWVQQYTIDIRQIYTIDNFKFVFNNI